MFRARSIQSSLSVKDKILSIDFILEDVIINLFSLLNINFPSSSDEIFLALSTDMFSCK